jgi:hypothetical protein
MLVPTEHDVGCAGPMPNLDVLIKRKIFFLF